MGARQDPQPVSIFVLLQADGADLILIPWQEKRGHISQPRPSRLRPDLLMPVPTMLLLATPALPWAGWPPLAEAGMAPPSFPEDSHKPALGAG